MLYLYVFIIIYQSNCIILGIYMSQKRPCPSTPVGFCPVQGAFAVKATTDDDGDALADAHARYSASMWQGDADFHRRRALEGKGWNPCFPTLEARAPISRNCGFPKVGTQVSQSWNDKFPFRGIVPGVGAWNHGSQYPRRAWKGWNLCMRLIMPCHKCVCAEPLRTRPT